MKRREIQEKEQGVSQTVTLVHFSSYQGTRSVRPILHHSSPYSCVVRGIFMSALHKEVDWSLASQDRRDGALVHMVVYYIIFI